MPLHLKAAFGATNADKFAVDESPRIRLGNNLGCPTQVLFDPRNEWPAVAAIGEQMLQTPEAPGEILQEQGSSSTINESCRMNLDSERQSKGIHQQMPFAPEDFFSRRRSRGRCLARDWS
ncbi:hypothetical protein KDH_28860 [Dictyobacter sp. S3.2.2.5]|uniref:Uncharacterized protein n=1 Tax=Dictyobacter halimunensis TaxID=3026934 RepID=A0ABQ6FSM9_9CHLR|nr:hypothetical protein KDH_28860 [Dictyobacter sp. S3.2.2.5]